MKHFRVIANGREKAVVAGSHRSAAENVTGCECWPFQDNGDLRSYTTSHSADLVIVILVKGEPK